jgi:hypothetical protein
MFAAQLEIPSSTEREKFSAENGVVLFIAIEFIIKILKKVIKFCSRTCGFFPFGLCQKKERERERDREREREIII